MVTHKLTVNAGEAVELAPSATVTAAVSVVTGGALDVEGASTKAITATGAKLVRFCAATVGGAVKITRSSGAVVLGDGTAECSTSTFTKAVTLTANTAGVSVDGELIDAGLIIKEGAGGTRITGTTVAKAALIKSNSGGVVTNGNKIGTSLSVIDNSGGATVTGNEVTANLTVTGNGAPVIDRPNEVTGKSKLQ